MNDAQRRKFFALLDELGIDKKEAEGRAVAKFALKDFKEISFEQMNEILQILEIENRKAKHIHGDREYDFRLYDYVREKLYYLEPTEDGMVTLPLNGKWYIDEKGIKHPVHVMEWTGRKDENGVKLFDYDFVRSYLGKYYTIQFSVKNGAWMAYEFDSDESIFLSVLQRIWKVGSIYEGMLEDV